MMGPATHFLVGMLCGSAIAALAATFRRRWLFYLPPFVLACGFWAEMPYLAGLHDTTHWAANIFFGYTWLHPWVPGREFVAFFVVLGLANLLLLGHVVFLSRYFGALDMVRWERGTDRGGRKPSRRRRPHRHRHEDEE